MPKLASGRKVAAPTDTWSEPMVRRLDEAGLDGGATLNEEAGRASSAPRFSYRARRRRLLRRAPTYVADIRSWPRALTGLTLAGGASAVGVGPPVLKTNRNQLDRWAQGATLLAIAVSVNRLVNRQYAMSTFNISYSPVFNI